MALTALREGRLAASPRRWLVDLRHLHRLMSVDPTAPPPPPRVLPSAAASHKDVLAAAYTAALHTFLASGARLTFSPVDRPKVAVILVLFNRAELTFRCLRSLAEHTRVPFEVIVVDNDSTDATGALLAQIDGLTIIRPGENLGFLRACNAAAAHARSEHLLFLNNDAELLPGSIAQAVQTLESAPDIGAVGGRLVLPDGRLQEAGSIVWRDGSCLGYGRDDVPWAPEYAFVRDVDYCSAALLLTPRETFLGSGGFDERYAPAYYEDSDYCVRLWKSGRRVVYDPAVGALHFEFASSASNATALRMQADRRALFVEAHRPWLSNQPAPQPQHPQAILAARAHTTAKRILFVDDQVPHGHSGFGFPRALDLLKSLSCLGHAVTLYPTNPTTDAWHCVYADVPAGVEVMLGHRGEDIAAFLRERAAFYDAIIVSRPHNMQALRARLGAPGHWAGGVPVVYDAEAIAAFRDVARGRLLGMPMTDSLERLIEQEVSLSAGAAAVMTVSEAEAAEFRARGVRDVHIVSHCLPTTPTARGFEARSGLLFVGAFHELSPNGDAVMWFVREVLPILRRDMPALRLTIVGQHAPAEILRLRDEQTAVHAGVDDLTPFYDAARVFVAPTRFAAGIPYKVGHAAAHGLPVVATSLLSRQLGWTSGRELLAADAPGDFAAACHRLLTNRDTWATVRSQALERVADEYAPSRFQAAVAGALEAVWAARTLGEHAGTRRTAGNQVSSPGLSWP